MRDPSGGEFDKIFELSSDAERFAGRRVKEEMKKKKKEKVSDDEKEEEDDEVVIEETLVIKSRAMREGVHVVRYWRFNRMAVRRYSVRSNYAALSVWMVGGREQQKRSFCRP